MPLRTELMQFFPWIGGVNTALDPSTIPQNALTRAESVVFGTRGSRKKMDGINFNWDSATTGTDSLVGLKEFNYGSSSKVRKFVSVTDAKKIYGYASGTQSSDLFAGTAWSSSITQAVQEVITNLCVIAVDGSGNVMKKWTGTGNVADLGVNTTTGDTHTSTTVDNLGSTAIITVGSAISGSGIPANTTVTAITSATAITISNAATATASGVTFTITVTPPQASMVRQHLGRLWANDKTNVDRLHYSETGNAEIWNGLGDSAALDIGVGDGDPSGITAIFPPFRGNLYVAKRTKLYCITGDTPETFDIQQISDSIGCVGPNAVCAMDQDEVYFISDRGVHALSMVQQYGDFPISFTSADIQPTVTDLWQRKNYISCAYVPNLNSIAVAVTDSTYGTASNNCVWLYNVPLKSWYSWPNVSCQSMIAANDSDKKRLYLGTNTSRIARAQNGTNYNIAEDGTHTAKAYTVKTGILFPKNQPYLWNSFKRFILFYRPVGTHTITATVKIDNGQPQAVTFSQAQTGSLLGIDLILGTSTLGYNLVMAPYAQTIDGHGHGIEVTLTQSGIEEDVEVQGFAIEYEPAGTAQEVLAS